MLPRCAAGSRVRILPKDLAFYLLVIADKEKKAQNINSRNEVIGRKTMLLFLSRAHTQEETITTHTKYGSEGERFFILVHPKRFHLSLKLGG